MKLGRKRAVGLTTSTGGDVARKLKSFLSAIVIDEFR